MMNKFVELTEGVLTIENEVNQNQKEIDKLEIEYLDTVVEIVKNGIEYKEIVTKEEDNQFEGYTNLEYCCNNEGELIEGLLLDKINYKNHENEWESRTEDRELYLLEDGTLKAFYVIWQWEKGNTKLNRFISQHQEVEQFDVDNIIKTIENHLLNRLNDLGNRKKAQLARLEKLQELKL